MPRAPRSGCAGVLPLGQEPCPVFIDLRRMATSRYCLMCCRCAGWRDSIHLRGRRPGAELLHINTAVPGERGEGA